MKKMKQYIWALVGIIVFSYACNKDDQDSDSSVQTSVAQLVQDTIHLPENGSRDTIEIQFNKPAPSSGIILLKKISATAIEGKHYKLFPASDNGDFILPVTQGQTKTYIIIEPIDNQTKDRNKGVSFKLVSNSAGILIGQKEKVFVHIQDDEDVPVVQFKTNEATLQEGSDTWFDIPLQLSHPVQQIIDLKIELLATNAQYNQNFLTQPLLNENIISIRIPAGQTTGALKVKLVDDEIRTNNAQLVFSILSSSTAIVGPQKSFQAAIQDNDVVQTTTIKEIRDLYKNSPVYFFGAKYIEGVVTTVNDNTEEKMLYLQDATGGLGIRFQATNLFKQGDKIQLDLKGTVLLSENGELVVLNASNHQAKKTGTTNLPQINLSLEGLFYSFESHEGKYVSVSPVHFTMANGATRFAGDQIISDGVRTAKLRTEWYASFANTPLPAGNKKVSGILIKQNNEFIIKPQILLVDIQ